MARLTRYLTEISRLRDIDAKKIVMFGLPKLHKNFVRNNWDMPKNFIGPVMSTVYDKFGLDFVEADPAEAEIAAMAFRKYFLGAALLTDANIDIYIDSKIEDKIKEFRDMSLKEFSKTLFVKEFIEVLSHELVHREQWIKSRHLMLSPRYAGEDIPLRRYLSFPQEIEAHAHDAAMKLHNGEKAPELEVYQLFGKKHPVFKRFMKKVYQFREAMKKRDEAR